MVRCTVRHMLPYGTRYGLQCGVRFGTVLYAVRFILLHHSRYGTQCGICYSTAHVILYGTVYGTVCNPECAGGRLSHICNSLRRRRSGVPGVYGTRYGMVRYTTRYMLLYGARYGICYSTVYDIRHGMRYVIRCGIIRLLAAEALMAMMYVSVRNCIGYVMLRYTIR